MVISLDALDVEESGGSIELFSGGPGGTLLAAVTIPTSSDGGLVTVSLGVSGVDFIRVTLAGSAAIDNIHLMPGITNTATVSGNENDPNPDNNHDQEPTGIAPQLGLLRQERQRLPGAQIPCGPRQRHGRSGNVAADDVTGRVRKPFPRGFVAVSVPSPTIVPDRSNQSRQVEP